DFRDAGAGANFDAGFASSVGDRIRDSSRAAAGESPGTERTVNLAHVVVEQDVGGARRSHAEERAHARRCSHGCFKEVGLEPLIEKVDRAHGHELYLVVLIFAGESLESASEEEQLYQLPQTEC